MSSKILKKEKNTVTVEFTVAPEEFENAVNKAYLKAKNSIVVQGFRKGKAPRYIIEKKYGKSVFYDDALDIAIQEAYPKAVKENNIDVINSPKVNIEKFEEGDDIVLTAEVEIMPEVELCQYKGIEVEKFEKKVADEDVENELKAIQDKNARIVEISDRPVQNGDFLTIDYKGFIGDEQFEGGTAENQALEIGSNTFIPGFEEQLIGKSKDEDVQINVKFPEDYNSEELKGKDATFSVKIHEIKTKELPEIDDEFAKDVSEFDTLEELKASTKSTLEKKAEEETKITNDNNVITKVVNECKVDIPEVLINREIDYLAKNYEQQFISQGFTGKQYEGVIKSFVEQYKEGAKGQAEFNVKAELVLEAIIEKEDVQVSDEELDEEINKVAESYKIDSEKMESFKKTMLESNKNYIEDTIKKRKVIEMLVESAKFVDKVENKEEKEDTAKK